MMLTVKITFKNTKKKEMFREIYRGYVKPDYSMPHQFDHHTFYFFFLSVSLTVPDMARTKNAPS